MVPFNKEDGELLLALKLGSTVKVKMNRFAEILGECGDYGDEGMLADVMWDGHVEGDEDIKLVRLDFAPYAEHNKAFERDDWTWRGEELISYEELCKRTNEKPKYSDIILYVSIEDKLAFDAI